MRTGKTTKYDTVAMALHWIVAVLMIFMIVFGEELMEEGETSGDVLAATFLPSVHVSVGFAILILSVARLAWRLMNPPPALPASMAGWEIAVTKITHAIFYALMIGIPLSGWLALGGFVAEEPAMAGIRAFGVFAVPDLSAGGEVMEEIHEIGSNAAMVLVILHVLAALKHQFVNRDDVLRRMLPH